jgi:hypothetical protein
MIYKMLLMIIVTTQEHGKLTQILLHMGKCTIFISCIFFVQPSICLLIFSILFTIEFGNISSNNYWYYFEQIDQLMTGLLQIFQI